MPRWPKTKEEDDVKVETRTAADQSTDEIGETCSQVVNKYTRPNINARTMLSMPGFWTDIAKALRGEPVEGLPAPEEEPVPAADPVLDSIEPESVDLGSPDVTVFFRGSGFTATSVIVWNGGDEPTGYVSETELTTVVKPSTASGAIDVPVSVRNDQVYTDPLTFSFTEPGDPETTDFDDAFVAGGDIKKSRKKKG
jgi:hypothetical protein